MRREVALHRIEVDDQRRRVDRLDRVAAVAGAASSHCRAPRHGRQSPSLASSSGSPSRWEVSLQPTSVKPLAGVEQSVDAGVAELPGARRIEAEAATPRGTGSRARRRARRRDRAAAVPRGDAVDGRDGARVEARSASRRPGRERRGRGGASARARRASGRRSRRRCGPRTRRSRARAGRCRSPPAGRGAGDRRRRVGTRVPGRWRRSRRSSRRRAPARGARACQRPRRIERDVEVALDAGLGVPAGLAVADGEDPRRFGLDRACRRSSRAQQAPVERVGARMRGLGEDVAVRSPGAPAAPVNGRRPARARPTARRP